MTRPKPTDTDLSAAAAEKSVVSSTSSEVDRLARRMARITTIIVVLATIVVFLVPSTRHVVFTSVSHLASLDFEGLRDYLRTFKGSAWIVSSFLMIAQSLAAPIPAVPITIANALIYGPWLGALVSWSSAQVAAAICFLIGRALGRPFVERLFSKAAVKKFDGFFERYGLLAILVARLVPVISFDIVSYAAGLTRSRLVTFLIATGLGQLPATIVYSFAGAELVRSPSRALFIALSFVGLVIAVLGVLWIRRRRDVSTTFEAGDDSAH